ncbi:MAG: hypothetical protein JWR19_1159 [Pedosphaera sp.]|nr:hypothetical protein [Pedosphaera sp.]
MRRRFSASGFSARHCHPDSCGAGNSVRAVDSVTATATIDSITAETAHPKRTDAGGQCAAYVQSEPKRATTAATIFLED